MEIRVLQYFWTVAVQGSVLKAASVLHVTQPTLSRQLHQLEAELGTPLFEKQHNHLVLTDAGRYLKTRAEEILSLSEATKQAFADRQNQTLSGTIRIGCVAADNSDTLTVMLQELIADYPKVQFDLYTATSEAISERLDKGLLDLAILLEPVDTAKYETLVLPRTEKWGLVVAAASSLATLAGIDADALRQTPLMLSRRPEVQQMLLKWAGAPVESLSVVGHFNLIFNVLPLIAANVGAALSIEGSTLYTQPQGIKFVPLVPKVQTHCVLVWRKQRVLSPAAAKLLSRFRHAFKA